MDLNGTTTQVVEEQGCLLSVEEKQRKYQEMFSKMKDCGKKSVYDLHKRFSTDDIKDFLECRDIYPVNFVEGWEENSKHWNQEEYDRMKKEFFKGFKEGLQELRLKSKQKKELGVNYWGFDNPWAPGYRGYKPWIYG